MIQIDVARPLALNMPSRLAFGPDGSAACASWVASRAVSSVLIVTSPQLVALCEPLVKALRAQGREASVWDGVTQEPRVADLDAAIEAVRDCRAGAVVAIGGGSAMDVAKLAAALADGRQRIGEVFGIGLLANPLWSGQKVAEIACSVGFVSSAHYTRAFRKMFGTTPTSYRSQAARSAV